jgi:hypothetical protein
MKKTLLALVCVVASAWGQEGTGPFPAVMETDPGLPTHTIYRPKDIAGLKGQKLPIVAWGEGACVNNGAAYRNYLTEIASHGFLVVAIGPPQAPGAGRQGRGGEGAAPGAPPAGRQGAPAGPATKSTQLIDGINWAIAENDRKDSPYYHKIDTAKIAVMGHSCGGIQSLAVAADPRITMLGIWSSGILNAPIGGNAPAMEPLTKDQLQKVHTPIFYISGDSSDIAFANGRDDFQRINKVPALYAYKDGIGHGGTYNQPNGGEFGKVAVALLEWQLKGDKEAGKMFLGADCGLCQDPKWHVEKKGIN